ncbi:MAG TPA: PAS domain S-box protein, partial [Methylophilaceae bacterium]|nr:PAS domain S-box protein [Methylophilaceae bacterium]
MANKAQLPNFSQLTQFTVDRVSDAIFWTGPDASFIYVNDAACRLLGYSRDKLLKLSVFDVDPNFSAEIWPTTWKNIKKAGSLNLESSLQALDGHIFPVEITANYIKFKDREYNCAIMREITQRKQAEESLKNMAVKYHTVFELSTDAIMLLDEKGFFDCN